MESTYALLVDAFDEGGIQVTGVVGCRVFPLPTDAILLAWMRQGDVEAI